MWTMVEARVKVKGLVRWLGLCRELGNMSVKGLIMIEMQGCVCVCVYVKGHGSKACFLHPQ